MGDASDDAGGTVAMVELAGRVRQALEAADLEDFRELLHPAVRWGAPDDATSGCHNRDQVLTWYRKGRANGVRATVSECTAGPHTILVGLRVSGDRRGQGPADDRDRWQVLTVDGGLITDIRGFDSREDAVSRIA
jgi:hypothetical protein